MEHQLEQINYIKDFIVSNQEQISVAATINLEDLSLEEKELVATIAGSCILNGPVGVGKMNFWKTPSGYSQTTNIRTLLKCGSTAWKNFCREICRDLKVEKCQTIKLWGNLWPLCEVNGQLPQIQNNKI